MPELAKGYKAHDTPDYANFQSYTAHTHSLSTNSTLEPSSSKKKKLFSS